MPNALLTCPHCSTRLRVRDRIHVGRPLPCPECRQPLLVVETPDGLSVTRGSAIDAETKINGKAKLLPRHALSTTAQQELRPPGGGHELNRARVIAWTAAGLLAVISGGVLFWPKRPASTAESKGWQGSNEVSPQPGANGGLASGFPPAAQPNPAANSDEAVSPTDDSPPQTPTENQLVNLGRDLTLAAKNDEAFPIGTFSTADRPLAQEDRFSWIAVLESAADPAKKWDVRWDRPWRDPHHDPFVRRRIPRWQNPLVPKLAGDDGYPATHFVGVAGVGEDSPRLPNGHARAGVFGDERQTRLDDIVDGASETMLLAGVAGRLGSWAAGGSATVRPFTREPFVNGPDGFGTGQAGSMFVLMADGSVRTISADIDPEIVQRLATIHDAAGSPDKPDPRVAGVERSEPPANRERVGGDERSEPSAGGARPGLPVGPAPTTPPAPEKTPPTPAKSIDIDAALRQPLMRFEQTQPVPLSQMLKQLEALLGAPLRIDDEHRAQIEPKLTTPVRVKLQRTTVRDVLSDVLHQANLTFRQDRDSLVLVPEGS